MIIAITIPRIAITVSSSTREKPRGAGVAAAEGRVGDGFGVMRALRKL
jgi:hypothetical protein